MGMKTTVTFPSGVAATYHRIDSITWERSSDSFLVKGGVGAYLDQASAEAGLSAIAYKPFSMTFPLSGGEPTRAQVYAALSAPVQTHDYQVEDIGEREDGSTGQVLVTKTVDIESSITGFNGAEMA